MQAAVPKEKPAPRGPYIVGQNGPCILGQTLPIGILTRAFYQVKPGAGRSLTYEYDVVGSSDAGEQI